MRAIRTLIALSVAAVAGACASPANTNAAASAGTTPMAMAAPGSMAATEPRMKAMHEMHQKMARAGTAAERQALMADHMKAMQGGTTMMKEMHAQHAGGGMPGMAGMGTMGSPGSATPMAGMGDGKDVPAEKAKRHQMMADHMAMMQMMMDMMADRMPSAATGR